MFTYASCGIVGGGKHEVGEMVEEWGRWELEGRRKEWMEENGGGRGEGGGNKG